MPIRILEDNLVNQIAAGEVLERPAAAVKELLENALDAGGTNLDVWIEQGGKSYLSVTDDGIGMSKADLSLAIERHATSKLPKDDLEHITSFGFRGEALPSIGAAARLCITSRAQSPATDSAYCIKVAGGVKEDLVPAALAKGTKVEVRDMFYATPARLKFLKSDATETAAIEDTIKRLAMSHPEVSFTLTVDGKKKLHLPAHKNLAGNISPFEARFGDIIEQNISENFAIIAHDKGEAVLTGFASLPTYTRGNSLQQYLFVNGRPVKDRVLLGAIKGAYSGLISHDRFPVVALFLTLPPEEVDVNVHPAKTEVRFKDAAAIRGLLVSGIKDALLGTGFKVASTISTDTFSRFTAPAFKLTSSTDRADTADETTLTLGLPLPAFIKQEHTGADEGRDYALREDIASFTYDTYKPAPLSAAPAPTPAATTSASTPPLGFAKAQIRNTYIISQTEDSLIITDQHAAHERLTYERIKSGTGTKESQLLLTPEIIDLGEARAEKLLALKPELEEMGLSIDDFGGGTVVVRAVPAILKNADIAKLIEDISDTIMDFRGKLSLDDKVKALCARMACHGSVRAGRKLTIDEMNALLRQMEHSPNAGECIHGRPTYIELKFTDIEKLFGRR